MHVAMIIDDERLTREQAMLNRLGIGMMAEGVQLTRIVAEGQAAETVGAAERRIALAARIEAPMRVLPWMRRTRAQRILEALREPGPDVFLAVGAQAWQVGCDLAKAAGRPVVIDVASRAQARMAPHSQSPFIGGYVTPCEGIGAVLRQRVDPELVSVVPMGVALPAEARAILADPAQPPMLAILGGSRDLQSYAALLDGLGGVISESPAAQIFLELRGPHEHEVWRQAERADLLGAISAIGEAAHYRALVTRCDLLLIPEALGELRSLMLEAMALGMPVIAAQDSALDMLVDGRSASLVRGPEAEEWSRVILQLLRQPEAARALGAAGRATVAERHRSSEQVDRLLEMLEKVVRGSALPFAAKG